MTTKKSDTVELPVNISKRLWVATQLCGGAMADPYGRMKPLDAAANAMKVAKALLKLEAEEAEKAPE